MLLDPPERRSAADPPPAPELPERDAYPESARERVLSAELGMPLVLAALMIYLGFNAGGYFADSTGWAAAALGVIIGVRALLSGSPPRGASWPLAWAAAALGAFGIWTLLSAGWSHAPSRALLEFDRVLLYTAALVLFGTSAYPERTLRRLTIAFVAATVVLCGAALFARILPHSWPFALPEQSSRMSWPLTYENALGALAALGIVMALQVASWRREHPVTRALAATALPVLAAALVLTFSRGGTLVAVVGVLVYLALCRSRGAITALIAAGPFTFIAAKSAYDADQLATAHLTSVTAIEQGHQLAATIGATAALAGLVMIPLMRLERRVVWPHRPPRPALTRLQRTLALGVALLAAAGVLAASGLPSSVYHKVVQGSGSGATDTLIRDRLTDPATLTQSQNRPKYWEVSLKEFRRHPIAGTGAGTFGVSWTQDRTIPESTTEGHSIFLEPLGELGVIGGALILLVLVLVLRPSFRRLRSERRPLYAGVVAAAVAWLLHAGIDWDWEMPVLTLWLFAMGGCALAASSRPVAARRAPRWRFRVLVAAMCAFAVLTPVTVALSQDRLDRSQRALLAGDCRAAVSDAHGAIDALSVRPEPYAIISYCEARAGRTASAVAWMHAAAKRDPRAWQYDSGLAVVQASGGLDPRPAVRAARALNPLERFLINQQRLFSGTSPQAWREAATRAQIPVVVAPKDETGGR